MESAGKVLILIFLSENVSEVSCFIICGDQSEGRGSFFFIFQRNCNLSLEF